MSLSKFSIPHLLLEKYNLAVVLSCHWHRLPPWLKCLINSVLSFLLFRQWHSLSDKLQCHNIKGGQGFYFMLKNEVNIKKFQTKTFFFPHWKLFMHFTIPLKTWDNYSFIITFYFIVVWYFTLYPVEFYKSNQKVDSLWVWLRKPKVISYYHWGKTQQPCMYY